MKLLGQWGWMVLFAASAFTYQPIREAEPVVLQGADLPQFLGVSLAELHLLAFSGGIWQLVPFQIDERSPSGSFFQADDGVWDANDELAFLGRSAGDQAMLTDWVDDGEARASIRVAIQVTDPVEGGGGWLYLYRSTTLNLSLPAPLVDYDMAADVISGAFYEVGFDSGGLIWDSLTFFEGAFNSGDLLDREKLRVRATVPLLGTLNLDENDIDPTGIFVREGMVRVIRLVEGEIDLILATLPIALERHYYDRFFEIPASGAFQIPGGSGLERIRFSTDFTAQAIGATFTDPNNSALNIDGLADPGVDLTITAQQQMAYYAAFEFMGFGMFNAGSFAGLAQTVSLYYFDNAGGGTLDGTPDTGDQASYGDFGISLTMPMEGEVNLAFQTYLDDSGLLDGPKVAGYLASPLEISVGSQDFSTSFNAWLPLWRSAPAFPDVRFFVDFVDQYLD